MQNGPAAATMRVEFVGLANGEFVCDGRRFRIPWLPVVAGGIVRCGSERNRVGSCVMPDAAVLATLGLILGLFFLGLELFIPTFGMLLILSIISLVVSFGSACKAWWGTSPLFFWGYVIVLLCGIPGSLMGAIGLLQGTRWGKKLTLTPPEAAGVTPESPLNVLMGKTGRAQTLMTPGGLVMVEGERFHAESTGMLVEPGTAVIVVGVRANRIVVRPQQVGEVVHGESGGTGSGGDDSRNVSVSMNTADKSSRLDFDIPSDYTQ
jgi:membrane protein implicated in regulation of membrane protease activity